MQTENNIAPLLSESEIEAAFNHQAQKMNEYMKFMGIVRPNRGTSNDIMAVYPKSVLDMFKHKGHTRVYAFDEQKQPTNFIIEKLIKPDSSVKDNVWNVIVDEPNEPHSLTEKKLSDYKEIISRMVKRHCTIHGEKAGSSFDVLWIDETLYSKVQIFPAWITLAGFDYEIDIVKFTNGKTEFAFNVITECDEAIQTMLKQTAAWYVKRNPIGQIAQQTEN